MSKKKIHLFKVFTSAGQGKTKIDEEVLQTEVNIYGFLDSPNPLRFLKIFPPPPVFTISYFTP